MQSDGREVERAKMVIRTHDLYEERGGVKGGDRMVIGPSKLSLTANNHNHNHTTHYRDKMCVCVGCVRTILLTTLFIYYSFCCIITSVWNGSFVLSTCVSTSVSTFRYEGTGAVT